MGGSSPSLKESMVDTPHLMEPYFFVEVEAPAWCV